MPAFPPEGSAGAAAPEDTTVLVVDDDEEILTAVRDMLTEAGYRVVGARHGREALTYLKQNPPPAAIVLDLMMPLLNGWELVERLRQEPEMGAVPVIVVTAMGSHWGYPVDPSMVVRKPFQQHQLLGLIRQVTGAPAPR